MVETTKYLGVNDKFYTVKLGGIQLKWYILMFIVLSSKLLKK